MSQELTIEDALRCTEGAKKGCPTCFIQVEHNHANQIANAYRAEKSLRKAAENGFKNFRDVCDDLSDQAFDLTLENENLKTRIKELETELKDIEDSYKDVINEACEGGVTFDTDDRVHCSCVPALRKEVVALKARIKEIMERLERA